MSCYTSLISKHPVVVLVAVGVFSVSCILISLTAIKLPNFSDPQLGFEARGTVIASRLTAWDNLLEATRPSGPLTVNPLGDRPPSPHDQIYHSKSLKSKTKGEFATTVRKTIPAEILDDIETGLSERSQHVPNTNISLIIVDDRNYSNASRRDDDTWDKLKNMEKSESFDPEEPDLEELEEHFHDDHNHLAEDGFFCVLGPGPEFSRVVVSPGDSVGDLMSLPSLHQTCGLTHTLTSRPLYPSLCENVRRGQCCQPWSLPNYIAMLHNRSSCFDITEDDVASTRGLIEDCSHFYYSLKLMPDLVNKEVPQRCRRHNTVYNLLHYVLDSSFLTENKNVSGALKNTMIFLPMARSSSVLEFYKSLGDRQLRNGSIYVSAIDFGLKNTLFDESLVHDTWLIALGAGFVLVCMWLYTGSLFITIMTIIAIGFSLGIAYFFYTLIFRLRFFPFMNLLASIVAVGIGADDAFILTKVWQCVKADNNNYTLTRLVQVTMRHSALSLLVTTVTTAAAFFSSYVSAITAVRCFSVFAGLAVIANYALMLTWLPASIVVSERSCWPPRVPDRRVTARLDRLLVWSVIQLRHGWLVVLTALALASISVVFYWPRLRLPDSPDFQLFASGHPFEQYDTVYKEKFRFEKPQKTDVSAQYADTQMPLRFVWGAVPEDNGDHMDPSSRGSLRLDREFDMADPKSQVWLKKFCRDLKDQPFFEPTFGLLLPNCFIESFIDWMNRRCVDPVVGRSRAPCCETSRFPFNRRVFNLCLPRATLDLYRTPPQIFVPGVAGPKFARQLAGSKKPPKVRALVVEFDSKQTYSTSYTEMDMFFKQVEAWSEQQMTSAPAGMRNGFFVSQLSFYDVQRTLAQDTVLAIAVSLTVSLAVLLTVTLNLLVSLYTILSITCIIFVTVAVLVLLGWKLNVLESIAVSVAIGLAVDFSLHYAVNYRMCQEKESREACVAHALRVMLGPSLMAGLTTAAAGAFMLPSSVLAYTQVGVFLLVVMAVSWLYSTYFLMCLLAAAGPQHDFGQLSYSQLKCWLKKRKKESEMDKSVYINVLSESNLSTSSTMCTMHTTAGENHELEGLTRHSCRYMVCRFSRRVRRSSSRKASLPVDQSQSPSATSATTVIHDDDIDVHTNHVT